MYSSWAYLYLRGDAIWNTASQGNVECGMVKCEISTVVRIEIVVFLGYDTVLCVCIYIHTHTHTHTYIYIYIYYI